MGTGLNCTKTILHESKIMWKKNRKKKVTDRGLGVTVTVKIKKELVKININKMCIYIIEKNNYRPRFRGNSYSKKKLKKQTKKIKKKN